MGEQVLHKAVNEFMHNQANMSAHSWVIRTAHNLSVTGSDQVQYNNVN